MCAWLVSGDQAWVQLYQRAFAFPSSLGVATLYTRLPSRVVMQAPGRNEDTGCKQTNVLILVTPVHFSSLKTADFFCLVYFCCEFIPFDTT